MRRNHRTESLTIVHTCTLVSMAGALLESDTKLPFLGPARTLHHCQPLGSSTDLFCHPSVCALHIAAVRPITPILMRYRVPRPTPCTMLFNNPDCLPTLPQLCLPPASLVTLSGQFSSHAQITGVPRFKPILPCKTTLPAPCSPPISKPATLLRLSRGPAAKAGKPSGASKNCASPCTVFDTLA